MLRRAVVAALLAGALAGLVVAARAPDPLQAYEDERELLSAASHLARSGTLSFAPVEVAAPAGDAFREPGYPFLLAAAWRLGGVGPARSQAELTPTGAGARRWRSVRAVDLALLAIASAACGLAAWRLGGAVAGGLAAALVAASPALQRLATGALSENAAVALYALVAASWAAYAAAPSGGRGALVAAVTGVAPLVRAEALVLVPVAAGLLFLGARRATGGRRRALRARVAWSLALLLPALLWMARTRSVTGHWALSDRGGLALAVRAELDDEVARVGATSALLAWTPLEGARERALERAPGLDLLDARPVGPGSFFTRTLRRWQAERGVAGADPLEVDARLRAEALGRFARRPLAHLAAVPVVAWRALFAERGPEWARPLDPAFLLGLLLGAGFALFLARAIRRRDAARLAFAAPVLAIGLFHALATEFLPRYALPLLPLLWTALAIEAAAWFDAPMRRRSRTAPPEAA